MKFCPRCGAKLEPGAKFCTKCGYKINAGGVTGNQSTQQVQEKVQQGLKKASKSFNQAIEKTSKSPWMKDPKHKKYLAIAGIALVALLLIGHVAKNGGSLTAPKTISFAKQSKQMGTHVWLETGYNDKNASIYDVDVLKNGKFMQYQIYDKSFTLGKVSKLSNRQIISQAKKQDRKYFDQSANEVRALNNGEGQKGQQNDLMGEKDRRGDVSMGARLFFVGKINSNDNGMRAHYDRMVSKDEYDDQFNNTSSSSKSDSSTTSSPTSTKAVENDLASEIGSHIKTDSTDPDKNPQDQKSQEMEKWVRNERCNALIKHIKATKYLAPKWQKLTFKNRTDDTGNKITSQKVTYKQIDLYSDGGTIDENAVNNTTSGQKRAIVDFMNALGDEHTSANKLESMYKKAFGPSYQEEVTKGLFKPRTEKVTVDLQTPLSQQIYNTRYIGYGTNYGYIFMKAQSKTQKAVLTKP